MPIQSPCIYISQNTFCHFRNKIQHSTYHCPVLLKTLSGVCGFVIIALNVISESKRACIIPNVCTVCTHEADSSTDLDQALWTPMCLQSAESQDLLGPKMASLTLSSGLLAIASSNGRNGSQVCHYQQAVIPA